MPLIFPAHQGLILPVAHRWPNRFDALALSIGATMPDLVDSALGFTFSGYFRQGYGHSLIGATLLDFPAGLLLTYLLALLGARYLRTQDKTAGHNRHTRFDLWSYSMVAGILSHLAFDFISHETSWLLYPWYRSGQYLPEWWYMTWFKIPSLPMFGDSYSVGPYTVIWCILTLTGVHLFFRYINSKN